VTGATALGNYLMGEGQRVAVLHGELEQRERNRVVGLLHSGRVNVLIATDVAARGLDIPGVQRVINFDLPRSGDDYLHRTGRTGRAGEQGVAISLVGASEWNRLESIERYLNLGLERRGIEGLKATYKGPTKRSGAKKGAKKNAAKTVGAKTAAPKPKDRLRDRKNIGKRRRPRTVSASETGVEAGHTPLGKRRTARAEPKPEHDGGAKD
jgi:ATP-dependent RNA helicase SrmB